MAWANMLPDTPAPAPAKFASTGISMVNPAVLLIKFGPTRTRPAVILGVNKSSPPMFNLDAKNDLTARCVGITLLLFCKNKPSLLNSRITAVDPTEMPPSLNSVSPVRSKKSALMVIIPVLCSTANNSPARKFPF